MVRFARNDSRERYNIRKLRLLANGYIHRLVPCRPNMRRRWRGWKECYKVLLLIAFFAIFLRQRTMFASLWFAGLIGHRTVVVVVVVVCSQTSVSVFLVSA